MKILKVRKGYTTNSSSSSEWMNPKDLEKFLMEGKSPSGSSMHNNQPVEHGVDPRLQHNVGLLSTVVGAVLSIFLLDKLMRAWWKQKKSDELNQHKGEE